jgi:hypothetical protein
MDVGASYQAVRQFQQIGTAARHRPVPGEQSRQTRLGGDSASLNKQ